MSTYHPSSCESEAYYRIVDQALMVGYIKTIKKKRWHMTSLILVLLFNFSSVLLIGLTIELWLFSERNRLQKTLMVVLLLWAAIFIGFLSGILHHYNDPNPPIAGVINFRYIGMGLIGLFSLIGYPALMFHRDKFNVRGIALYLSPLLLTFTIYIVWHLWSGEPMNRSYPDYSALWANRFTIPVILRTLMLLFFLLYPVLALINLHQLIPLYEKYSDDNYTDTAHNGRWLRLVGMAIGSISTAYLLILIVGTPVVQILFAAVACTFFVLLAVNAFSNKHFIENERIVVEWSLKRGWLFTEKPTEHLLAKDLSTLTLRLNTWIQSEKPFTHADFSARDIYALFPELRPPVLRELLAEQGLTFNSYVRKLRIEEACRLMESEPDALCKQIAFKVGFSSSQILSRAFVAVVGQTPLEYRKLKTGEL